MAGAVVALSEQDLHSDLSLFQSWCFHPCPGFAIRANRLLTPIYIGRMAKPGMAGLTGNPSQVFIPDRSDSPDFWLRGRVDNPPHELTPATSAKLRSASPLFRAPLVLDFTDSNRNGGSSFLGRVCGIHSWCSYRVGSEPSPESSKLSLSVEVSRLQLSQVCHLFRVPVDCANDVPNSSPVE
jgi:hypothetical protein